MELGGNGHISKIEMGENIKFCPLENDNLTDSDFEEDHVTKGDITLTVAGSPALTHPPMPTVFGGVHSRADGEKASHHLNSRGRLLNGLEKFVFPDYDHFDHEVDVTLDTNSMKCDQNWAPRFLQDISQLADDPHTTSRSNDSFSEGGRRDPQHQGPKYLSRWHESARWRAFWMDVDEKINTQRS